MQKQSLDFSILLMELFISFILLVIILLPTSHTSLVQSISSSSFTKSYHSVKQWGSSGSGNGQFSNPSGIAIDSSNRVYVADSNNDRIQKFDNNGTFIKQWGSGDRQSIYPSGIAIDSSGKVYVTDDYIGRIQKFDNNGTFIKQWGSSGSGNGQFSNPHGIAIDSSGNVYVADSGNKRIQKSNGDGNVITTLDTGSKISAQFHNPIDIAANLLGILYVVDGGNNRIDVFAPTVQTSSILDNYSGNKTSLQSVGISDQV
ncbi:MAG TPA: SBBP repeat-containing protein [Candidatus Sulfopaludibacter sp.]|nr:SBBP repeat-containing protein [Candidatus Sulfopaludibacter sp.]